MIPVVTLWFRLEIASASFNELGAQPKSYGILATAPTTKLNRVIPAHGSKSTMVKTRKNKICNYDNKVIFHGKETASSALRKRMLMSTALQVADDSCRFYIYTAYLDDLENKIRVLGIAKVLKATPPMRCLVWNDADDKHPKETDMELWYLSDVMKRRYSVKQRTRPYAVSVTMSKSFGIRNIVKISYPSPKKYNITVCFTVLHSNYKNVQNIISFIEMNRILGAQKFVLYNYSIAADMSLVLDEYEKAGLLETVQWDIPVDDIHYFAQNVVINDCLYRNLHVSKYLVYTDMDELIIPRKMKTCLSLIQTVIESEPKTGSLMFLNTFFRTNAQWKIDTHGYNNSSDAWRFKITPLPRVWRENFIYPLKVKSKQIVLPERVRAVRIHLVDKNMYRKRFKVYVVLPEDGLLHHYRWMSGEREKVKDDFVRKYSDLLLRKVKERYQILNFRQNLLKENL